MKENNTYNEELGGKNLPDSLRVNPFLAPKNFFEEQQEQILRLSKFEALTQVDNVSETKNATDINIPEGYFDTLSDNIFSKIVELDLKEKVPNDGFSIPNNYFDELNQDIHTNIVEEKLKSFVPTLDFEVSDDYFETAENQIFAKLAEQKLIDQVGQDNGFTVPVHYFEEANTGIEANILVEKWQSEISKDNFSVPAGYFDQLTENILAKTSTKQETTIITLPKRTNWRTYSAAAAIALVIGLGSYFGIQNIGVTSNQIAQSDVNLENVSDEEIISYLAQVSEGEDLIHLAEYASDMNDETSQLDPDIENEEIEEYLNYML